MASLAKTKPVTIRTVASRAGVSAATVSRVFGAAQLGGPAAYIKPATERRVRRAAEKVGYFPNAAASRLRRRTSRILGLIISDLGDSNHSIDAVSAQRIGAIEGACTRRGYGLQLMRSAPGDSSRLMGWIASRSVDGLILTGTPDARLLDLCTRLELPCIDVVGQFAERTVCTVEADLVTARLGALRYLAGLGHRKIGVACVNSDRQRRIFAAVASAAEQDDSTRACSLTRLDLPHTMAVLDAAPLIAGYLALPAAQRPTAILAHENTLLAFLGEMAAQGLSCPRDISLIGLSRTPLSDISVPRLTGIDNQDRDVSRCAVELLIDRLESHAALRPDDSPPMLKCEMVLRDSCAAPR